MLTQGRFLISYQIFDNIPVNNIGQTHVREILKDTQAFTFSYRTEQIRDYLRKSHHNRYHTHSSAMITMVCIYNLKCLYLQSKI